MDKNQLILWGISSLVELNYLIPTKYIKTGKPTENVGYLDSWWYTVYPRNLT